ncbi:MAG: thioredoxin family protein [Balneolaceae bacterium]
MAQTDTDITSFRWYDLEEAQERAESEQKNVFIFTEAEWCAYCRQMKAEVFPKSEVQKTLQKHFYPVKIDIESDNVVTFNGEKMTEREFSHSMRISATPTMIFLDSSGDILGVQPGFIPEEVFTSLLDYIGNNHIDEEEFEEYLKRHER